MTYNPQIRAGEEGGVGAQAHHVPHGAHGGRQPGAAARGVRAAHAARRALDPRRRVAPPGHDRAGDDAAARSVPNI